MNDKQRRLLINLIVILAIAQAGILIYLQRIRREEAISADVTPTSSPYQLPSAATRVPSVSDQFTPTPRPRQGATTVAAGGPISAANFTRYARMFDEEQAMAHITYLASHELGGRQPGTSGGRAAADYIAQQFAEYGLEPAGIDATYFQTFTVPYGRITEMPVLTVFPPGDEEHSRPYIYRTDYRALTGGYVGAGKGEGAVIWLSECLHDDYAGLDMVGKIVLCRYSDDTEEVFRQAVEHQVGGILLLDREGRITPYRRPGYRETAWVPQTIPAFVISETVALDLLSGTDYTLDDLSLRFTATPLSTTARMAISTEEKEDVEAHNVLGLLPGSDPGHSEEIVIIGAHYDHLGREPDGAIMNGANDNASGVATVLEIARLWRKHSVRPARSVLFAAWDGEELGLLGSRHYVDQPTLPITNTFAMLNLDMVSTGDELQIDGESPVAAQLQASAEVYGITTTIGFNGRSDHMSFHRAAIPAAMLIYWPDPYYHSVDDETDVLVPHKLKTAGVLSSHALAALAQDQVELEQAVERFQASIISGDRESFIAGIDPRDPDLRAAQAAWFDNLWSHDLTHIVADPELVRIGDGEAQVDLTLAYRWTDTARRQPAVTPDVRFVERDGAWYFAGYELDEISGPVVAIARFPDVPVSTRQLLSTTQRAYLSLCADLALQPTTGTRFVYYPDSPTMQTIARPTAERSTRWLVPSAGLAEIAYGQPITPALVNLTLNQMGLPPNEGAWLRAGLVEHYSDSSTEHLGALVAEDREPVSPLKLSASSELPDDEAEAQTMRGYAWSATDYLMSHYGSPGLRNLCAAWGKEGMATAFRDELGLTIAQFETAWRSERIDPLRTDTQAIQQIIATRAEALLTGDEVAFLSTINPADPALLAEEKRWFADLSNDTLASYEARGTLIQWKPGDDEAIATMQVDSVLADGATSQLRYNARFVRKNGRWYYAGAVWDQQTSDHFVLKYDGDHHDVAWAKHVLDLAEQIRARVMTDLNATLPLKQEIKLYDSEELFRAAVGLRTSNPDQTWTKPGETIRIRLGDSNDDAIQRAIVKALTHQFLLAEGLRAAWLRGGIADFEAGQVVPLGTHQIAGRYLPTVQEAIRRHNDLSFDELSAFEALADDQIELAQAQSWSIISFIVEQYGLPALQQFIDWSIVQNDPGASLRAVLDVEPEAFLDQWRDWAHIGCIPSHLVALARTFDPERTVNHIRVLASPELGGREAGTRGADLSATYIADQFAALGLEPLGDPLTTTIPSTTPSSSVMTQVTALPTHTAVETNTVSHVPRDYLQRFSISHTHLISVPVLTLLNNKGEILHQFAYHEEFVERAGTSTTAEAELVWVRADSDLTDVHFGGAVVLYKDVRFSSALAEYLRKHGASGLIIATRDDAEDLQAELLRSGPQLDVTLPAFKITEAAYEIMLDRLDMTSTDLGSTPPVLPLGASVRLALARTPVTRTQTTNVLGLLPGNDPNLADEVLLIGAHYDHAGQTPDGFYFPGANQNASGVAAMLELAQIWRSTGFQPARSVLFAAWGAEEKESAGVTHYLNNPAIPLTKTIGIIALDSIAGGQGHKLLFYGTREHDQALIQRMESAAAVLDRRTWRRGSTGEGWHEPFNAAGIPTLKLIWDEAQAAFYSPTDTAEAIDRDRLANSGEILALTISWLAGR